ncbi:hypothetical protein U9M48_037417 [Paspalum notatum var. saurae]|uniref:Uncharacterized protein n=1 Tax=Paspalum notatum var. saurae TaxID=547442 RepID=A0AAQ3UEY3_PASNO
MHACSRTRVRAAGHASGLITYWSGTGRRFRRPPSNRRTQRPIVERPGALVASRADRADVIIVSHRMRSSPANLGSLSRTNGLGVLAPTLHAYISRAHPTAEGTGTIYRRSRLQARQSRHGGAAMVRLMISPIATERSRLARDGLTDQSPWPSPRSGRSVSSGRGRASTVKEAVGCRHEPSPREGHPKDAAPRQACASARTRRPRRRRTAGGCCGLWEIGSSSRLLVITGAVFFFSCARQSSPSQAVQKARVRCCPSAAHRDQHHMPHLSDAPPFTCINSTRGCRRREPTSPEQQAATDVRAEDSLGPRRRPPASVAGRAWTSRATTPSRRPISSSHG